MGVILREANVFNVGACLFGMVILAEFVVFLLYDCLGNMVDTKLVVEMVVDVVVGEATKAV